MAGKVKKPTAKPTTAKGGTRKRTARGPAAKTATKTPTQPVLIPQPNGRGALLSGGIPGNKGGRPPNEHIEWCRAAINDPECEAAVLAVLKDRRHPAFATMWKVMAERGYGKPVQPISGPDGGPVAVTVTRRIVDPDGDRG